MGPMKQKKIQLSAKKRQRSCITTYVVNNIDWKNKTFNGRETDNTNSILIPQEHAPEHTNQDNVT